MNNNEELTVENLDHLGLIAGIMVADSALYSQNNLKMLQNIPWISRVPLSLKSAKNLVKQLPESSLVESGIKGYTKELPH